MKTEITKIKLQLKDRAVELTAAEAREIQKELNKLFEMESDVLKEIRDKLAKTAPMVIPYPYPAPIIIERNVPVWPRPWTVEPWCGTTTVCEASVHSGSNTGMLCIPVGQVS